MNVTKNTCGRRGTRGHIEEKEGKEEGVLNGRQGKQEIQKGKVGEGAGYVVCSKTLSSTYALHKIFKH